METNAVNKKTIVKKEKEKKNNCQKKVQVY